MHTGAGLIGVNDTGTVNGGTIDIADLEIGGAATMTFNGGSVAATNFVKESGGILVHDGGDFTVDGRTATFNSSHLFSGPSAVNQPTFHVENGADVAVKFAWRVGESAGEFGTTHVNGTGGSNRSTLRGTGGGGGADLIVGHFGSGQLHVTGGGRVDFGDDMIIGNELGSDGLVTLAGMDGANRSELIITRAGGNAALNVGRFASGASRRYWSAR